MAVTTPLAIEPWEKALAPHPDRAYACYICNGLQHGFRVGFQYGALLKSAAENTHLHTEVITNHLCNEGELQGRMLGPFSESEISTPIHINRFGVIPKGTTWKFRLITDLSFPLGSSVNNAIDPDLCSMVYTTVDEVAARAAQLGRGTLLAKVDIESAYRLVSVHPQDWIVQEMKWGGASARSLA